MRILVTNDDGLYFEGLKILVDFAKTLGDVIVVAPKEEQSAKGQSINIRTGFSVRKVDLFKGVETYEVDSTPADCVRFAIYYLKDKFDIVFSGLNKGYNCGEDILYSGTIAAATESVLVGRKAIAFSADCVKMAGRIYIKEAYDYIIKNKLLEKHPFWNVNLPENSKGIKITRQGKTNFDTYFEKRNGLFYQMGEPFFSHDQKEDSDTKVVHDGYISISAMSIDRTISL